jgi:hypothetical protein
MYLCSRVVSAICLLVFASLKVCQHCFFSEVLLSNAIADLRLFSSTIYKDLPKRVRGAKPLTRKLYKFNKTNLKRGKGIFYASSTQKTK